MKKSIITIVAFMLVALANNSALAQNGNGVSDKNYINAVVVFDMVSIGGGTSVSIEGQEVQFIKREKECDPKRGMTVDYTCELNFLKDMKEQGWEIVSKEGSTYFLRKKKQ